MNALILSAGVGKRMRPITNFIPKALMPIVGKPLIDITISQLRKNDIDRIGVNIFHHSGMLKEHLANSFSGLYVATEDILKGTGGALLNFLDFITENFVVYSGDIITDLLLSPVVEYHTKYSPVATLVMIKHELTNYLKIDEKQRVIEISDKTHGHEIDYYTFSGVSVFSRRVLSYLPDKDVFSMVEVFQNILDNNETIMGFIPDMKWYNINSPYVYWQIHHDLLTRKVALDGFEIDSCFHVDQSSDIGSAQLSGFASIGAHCKICDEVKLHNTVVFEDSTIRSGTYNCCLLSNNFCIEVDGSKL